MFGRYLEVFSISLQRFHAKSLVLKKYLFLRGVPLRKSADISTGVSCDFEILCKVKGMHTGKITSSNNLSFWSY